MQKPVITEVAIKKEGRFWSVKTDGKLLAVVLYRKGAEAVQDLVQRLAGIPVTTKADATATKDPKAKPPGKKADKPDAELERKAAWRDCEDHDEGNFQRSTLNTQNSTSGGGAGETRRGSRRRGLSMARPRAN